MKIGPHFLRVIVLLVFGALFSIWGWSLAFAQEHDESCNIAELTTHWAEHAVDLSSFAETADEDLDTALRELYIAGIAYQALALNCGFGDVMEAKREHDAAHELEVSEADHDAEAMEFAMSIGDPENGQILFNTLQPEVAFACATCHYVDSMERLVGPGLMGVGNPAHDPSAHAMTDDEDDHEMTMDEDAKADEHTADEMAMTDEEMANMTGSMDEVIEYIHTSILDPSAFVVESFPDNLMPSTYKDVFTEEEINDLIAYLLTLQ